jgi:hypothetical protein
MLNESLGLGILNCRKAPVQNTTAALERKGDLKINNLNILHNVIASFQ